jgi:hypothetical protein
MSSSAVNAAPPQPRNAWSAAPSPARHGGRKNIATAVLLALSRNYAGEGSVKKRNLQTESGEIP